MLFICMNVLPSTPVFFAALSNLYPIEDCVVSCLCSCFSPVGLCDPLLKPVFIKGAFFCIGYFLIAFLSEPEFVLWYGLKHQKWIVYLKRVDSSETTSCYCFIWGTGFLMVVVLIIFSSSSSSEKDKWPCFSFSISWSKSSSSESSSSSSLSLSKSL